MPFEKYTDYSYLYIFGSCGVFFLDLPVFLCYAELCKSSGNFQFLCTPILTPSTPTDPHFSVPRTELGLARDGVCLGLGFGLG